MKDFEKMNNTYLRLKRIFGIKIAYKLTTILF